ncbi:FtsX-like permease family protein [Streptococcus merionis]
MMKISIYWRDIWRSIRTTKGRFLSIVSLMALGSFALVGLKAAGPNLEQTGAAYLDKYQVMDLAVMADYGLGKNDQKELKNLDDAQVEFGYLTDKVLDDATDAVRVFSKPNTISQFQLLEGELPTTDREIALSANYQGDYQLGDTVRFTDDGDDSLAQSSYTLVGFVNASDIWSKTSFGATTKGTGELSGYAVVVEEAFKAEQYAIARLRYDDLAELNPFDSAYTKALDKHQADLENLLKDNGAQRLAELKKDPQAEIDKGQAAVNEAKTQLNQQTEQLKAFGRNMSDVPDLVKLQEAISEEQGKLDKAQKELNDLEEPEYQTYTRRTLPGGGGFQTYGSSAESISQVANIFPVVLYFVAALVTFTTMTRFVDEERTNAGIFKALGYSRAAIRRKFVIYGLVAGLIGTMLGILGGHFILAPVIANIITSSSTIGAAQLFTYPDVMLWALALSLISAVLPAYLIANKGLREKTAYLLQPKPPVKGSTILLERVNFIWNRLSFTHKVTARNIFRYKQRMLMTIFGVAGSVALLYAGLGIRSSLSGIAETQFGQILTYDMLVVENVDATDAEKADLQAQLKDSDIALTKPIYTNTFEKDFAGLEDRQSVTLMVAEGESFGNNLHILEAKSKKELPLPSQGAILSEKLAQLYKVGVGDSISVTVDDKEYSVKVAGIAQLFTGHFIFMSQTAYENAFDKALTSNSYLVSLKDNSDRAIKAKATDFLKLPAVSALSQNRAVVEQVNQIVNSLTSTMLLLILVSILLAVVILYNLTNINVAERIRELSTIKVLGFHNKEVTLYIYRETIMLTLIGIGLGLVTGHYLHQFLINMIAPSNMMFNPKVTAEVWLIPLVAVSIILAVLGWLVNHRLKSLDMLEALKANE